MTTAAIAIFNTTPDGVEQPPEELARFYPHVTNNICEGIAILEGIRKTRHILTTTPVDFVNIVIDSQLWYGAMTKGAKIRDAKLKPIADFVRAEFATIAGNTAICHMLRTP
jgi:ribonuclease HI